MLSIVTNYTYILSTSDFDLNYSHNHQNNPQEGKEKSQLCRRYIQYGFCPYQKKCKFAHGSHQLLKNNKQNMKYKTKQCQNFKNNYFCIYGNRCNFIHTHLPCSPSQKEYDLQLKLIRRMKQKESRLLRLLHVCKN